MCLCMCTERQAPPIHMCLRTCTRACVNTFPQTSDHVCPVPSNWGTGPRGAKRPCLAQQPGCSSHLGLREILSDPCIDGHDMHPCEDVVCPCCYCCHCHCHSPCRCCGGFSGLLACLLACLRARSLARLPACLPSCLIAFCAKKQPVAWQWLAVSATRLRFPGSEMPRQLATPGRSASSSAHRRPHASESTRSQPAWGRRRSQQQRRQLQQ